jgi:hypothetical protein
MLAASAAIARAPPGQAPALGLFGYFLYQYLEYAAFWALGPLFPLFIALNAATLRASPFWHRESIFPPSLPEGRPGGAASLQGMAILCIAMSAVLAFMWTGRIAAALTGGVQEYSWDPLPGRGAASTWPGGAPPDLYRGRSDQEAARSLSLCPWSP